MHEPVGFTRKHLCVRERDNAQSLRRQCRTAGRIARDGEGVNTANDLDHQGMGGEQQVAGVGADARLDQRIYCSE
jgi:hypothetical protein